jgi:hypothetical protein
MINHKPLPPLDELKEHLYLDETSPTGLRWAKPFASNLKPGDVAGSKVGAGYYGVRFKYTKYYVHRIILLMKTEEDPGEHWVDHISVKQNNHDVRIATAAQNHANRQKQQSFKGKKTSSIYKGVYWAKKSKKWCAQIKSNKKTKNLGLFDSEAEAALAYNKAAKELWGEYARLNTVE